MRFTFDPEQVALAQSVRRVLEKESAPADVRALWADATGRNPRLWHNLAAVGIPAMLIPAEFDGADGTVLDLCLVLEEVGRACVPDALVEACVTGPSAIALGADSAACARWLPAIASGELRVSVAMGGAPVPDAHVSDLVVVEAGGCFRVLDRRERVDTPLKSADPSRRIFRVSSAPGAGTPLSVDAAARAELAARQQVGSAAVLIGIAQALLDKTLAYVAIRYQFGRAIGSFQGVKHQLAQAASLVATARIAVRAATARLAAGDRSGHDAARLARICAADAEQETNRVALQLHGGIGFTWENDLQLWLKRGKTLEQADGGHDNLARLAGARTLDGLSA